MKGRNLIPLQGGEGGRGQLSDFLCGYGTDQKENFGRWTIVAVLEVKVRY